MQIFGVIKVLFLTGVAFALAMSWSPILTHLLYKLRLGKHIRDAASAPVFAKMHEAKRGTPTMGGIR